MTRDDLKKFRALDLDFSAIGLEWGGEFVPYFCTPVGAEEVGSIGCDGIQFVLLPDDEKVYCVDPAMGDVGTYVLPVAGNFREFLSFLLCCHDANPLSQIYFLTEERFQTFAVDEPGRGQAWRSLAGATRLGARPGRAGTWRNYSMQRTRLWRR